MNIRLLAPEGVTTVSIAGVAHEVIDRVVTLPAELVHLLEGHGDFTSAPEPTPAPAPPAPKPAPQPVPAPAPVTEAPKARKAP